MNDHRLLVIANETCPCPALQDEVRDRAQRSDSEVLVVAPALNSRLAHWVSDTDEAVADARLRLDSLVEDLCAHGVRARGQVGDAKPITAVDDALAAFAPDQMIVSTHPSGRSHWLESGLLEDARERFDGELVHFVSSYGAERAVR